jgi:hypothetical protein
MTVKVKLYYFLSFVSVILTIILYSLTYDTNVGFIVRLVLLKVIKIGRAPVAESSTAYTLVLAL